ncbi:hypothetical protein M0R45_029383 [Rubus argutus]|uniref:Uncharacterized protein n=1 Tax=Rubus argutus TaxID=59490 RepID=A0AAW1WAE3_RUBAR
MSEFLTFGAQEMLTKVASLAAQEFNLVWGFKGELTQLRESFSMLKAMLRDAEQSEGRRGEAVEMWVKKLEDIAHDADDVLDDYGYELLRRKVELQNQMKRKVLNFFSLSNPFAFRFKTAHKINNINKSLVILRSKALEIGLVAHGMVETSHNIRVVVRETNSGFKIDENNIFGRDQVVSDIVEALTNSNNNQESYLSVMAIVGLGGLGKTTVAKSIFHDARIHAHFHERLWVCVSTHFEIKSILRGVLESLKSKNAAVQTIEAMCGFLKEELQGTDTRGSKIIVTTRSDKVGKIVETLPRPDLEKLSVEDCWRILKDKSMGSAPLTLDQAKIGRRIATKCGGVPLVAKVLGGIMRTKTSDEWADIKELPVTIGKLKHLRYLDVSHTQITALPKSLGKLYNLQTLRLHNLKLAELPNVLSNLINLRHVYFGQRNWNVGWIKTPAGMGKLTNLRSLSSFTVGKEKGCGIEELADLNKLKAELWISKLELVRDGNEAKKANLVRKSNLRRLRLGWSDEDDRSGSRYNMNDEDVLEGLQPLPNNLELLEIHNFMGGKFPLWKGSTPNNLKVIKFHFCIYCERVPTLGHLPNLERLNFHELRNLRCVGSEFYGYDDVVATTSGERKVLFPALNKLHIKFTNNLIEWMGAPTDRVSAVFPCLEELLLDECAKLTSAPSHFPALMKLYVDKCNGGIIASILSNEITTLTDLKIREVKGLAYLPEGTLPNNKNLASLDISLRYIPDGINPLSLKELIVHDCNSLESIPISQAHATLLSLQELLIEGCSNLTSIPIPHVLPSLRSLVIVDCPELSSLLSSGLERLGSLEKLTIRECHNLETVPSLDKLTNLRDLGIYNCAGLTSLPSGLASSPRLQTLEIGGFSKELDSFPDFQVTSAQLRSLTVYGWPKLNSLPEHIQYLTSLIVLNVEGFPELEAIPEWLCNLASLVFLSIESCKSVMYLPSVEAMRCLTEIEVIEIKDCPILKERCNKETGVEWPKISRIPVIRESRVDNVLHELLQSGDSAQKYMQGSRSKGIDNWILLDNYVQERGGGSRAREVQSNSKRSKKRKSMKQQKKHGLFDLPQDVHR